MSRLANRPSRRRGRWLAGAGIVSLGLVLPARAIEMFTNFGDGSRIGLPSLEVPVQAYPGIPLRSDRIRARSRSQQARSAAEATPRNRGEPAEGSLDGAAKKGSPNPGGDGRPGIPGGGITIRPMGRQPFPPQGVAAPGKSVLRTPVANGFPTPPAAAATPATGPESQGTAWSNFGAGGANGLAPAVQETAPGGSFRGTVPAAPARTPAAAPGALPGFNQPLFPGTGQNPPAPPRSSPGSQPGA
jgi:hypothetical protein